VARRFDFGHSARSRRSISLIRQRQRRFTVVNVTQWYRCLTSWFITFSLAIGAALYINEGLKPDPNPIWAGDVIEVWRINQAPVGKTPRIHVNGAVNFQLPPVAEATFSVAQDRNSSGARNQPSALYFALTK